MLKVSKKYKFKSVGSDNTKTQIILCHTSRGVKDYLTSLKFRYNKNYDRIPNFLISKEGEIYQLMEDKMYSRFLSDEDTNKKSIIISLENYGWLKKMSLKDNYITWDRTIYNGKIHTKKWRGMYFWDSYTDDQINSLTDLCIEKLKKYNISNKFVGNSGLIKGIKDYEGIVVRSNYNLLYTDLNPSFNFENFKKNIENG
jgi:N-acetyl-anhydromuramyl-L-alanine amidase AmpD